MSETKKPAAKKAAPKKEATSASVTADVKAPAAAASKKVATPAKKAVVEDKAPEKAQKRGARLALQVAASGSCQP